MPHQFPLHQSIPKDQSMKVSWRNIKNWRSWKMRFFRVDHFNFLFFSKKNLCFSLIKTFGLFIWGYDVDLSTIHKFPCSKNGFWNLSQFSHCPNYLEIVGKFWNVNEPRWHYLEIVGKFRSMDEPMKLNALHF